MEEAAPVAEGKKKSSVKKAVILAVSAVVLIAAAVAVLHATTIISAPCPISQDVISLALPIMYSRDFSPYGQWALSDQ